MNEIPQVVKDSMIDKEEAKQEQKTPEQFFDQAMTDDKEYNQDTTNESKGISAIENYSQALYASLKILDNLRAQRLAGTLREEDENTFSENMTIARSARTSYLGVKGLLEQNGRPMEDANFSEADRLLREIESE